MKNKRSCFKENACPRQPKSESISNSYVGCYNPCDDGRVTKTMQLVLFLPCLILVAGLFIMWSFYTLYINVLLNFTPAILYGIIFFSLGSFLGGKEVRAWRFHKERCKELITIPRNYSTTVLILLSIILKIFWGYFYNNFTDIPDWMYIADMITSSIASGFFAGRTGFFFKKYLQNC